MRSRIMVVGRDVAQRAHLARLLSGNGYRVEIAESAAHARRIGFDGIELAIVAPDGLGPAGRGLVQDLRAAVGRVLLVAAPGDKGERHGHLRDVSDEAALLARVAEALAPAAEPEALEPVLQFAGYRLDLAGHSLLDTTGKEVPLTHGEFGLLRVFVQRAGRVLSRDQLLQLLSGRDAEAYDRSIDMQIVRLRRKIEPDPKRPTLIVTIPNSGYKFTATVRQVEAAASRDPEPAATPPETRPVGGERRFVTAVAAEVLAAEGSSLPRDPEELRPLIDAWRRYAARRRREARGRDGGKPAAGGSRLFRLSGGAGTRRRACAPRRACPGRASACRGDGASCRPGDPGRRGQRPRHRRPGRRGAGRGAGGGRHGCRILPSRARSSSPQARGGWPAICSPIATSAGSLSGASVRCRRGRCLGAARSAAAPRRSTPRR